MLLKKKLLEGKHACIAWNQSGSNYISEIFARAGFDGVIIDLEHGPFSLETTAQHCQAVQCTNTIPFARVADSHSSTIKRVLDTGIHGLLIPQISSAEHAQQAVSVTKYPPQGIRGVAGSSRAAGFGYEPMKYFQKANDSIFVALVIETVEGYENLDTILCVDGFDAVFIGPVDLASSMGHLGNPAVPEVQEVIADIEKKVLVSNKFLGTVAGNDEQITQKFAKGYNFLMIMSDVGYLSRESNRLIQKYG